MIVNALSGEKMTINNIKKSTIIIITTCIVAFSGFAKWANNQGIISQEGRDIIYAVKAMKLEKEISDKQISQAANMAVSLCEELDDAAKAITIDINKKKGLDHIINAKGIMADMKKMGIPVDKYARDIHTVELMWKDMK